MFSAYPLSALLSQYFEHLVAQLGGVRDGSEEAIHQARVAVRRVREALAIGRPVAKGDRLAAVDKRLARAGRALSRTRDADVGQRIIHDVATRLLVASRPLAHLRAETMQQQVTLRRKAIKRLEALELESLTKYIKGVRWQRAGWLTSGRAWPATLGRHIVSRAAGVHAAIERAGSVYFPNRLHAARVAIKRLRYTFELADQTRQWRPRGGLRLLKRVQEILGDAHDRQVLLDRFADLREVHPEWSRDETDALDQYMRAEILALHGRYIELRPEVLAVCDACTSVARRWRSPTRALLVAGVVVPTVVLLRRRSGSSGTATPDARLQDTSRRTKTA